MVYTLWFRGPIGAIAFSTCFPSKHGLSQSIDFFALWTSGSGDSTAGKRGTHGVTVYRRYTGGVTLQ